VLLERHRDERPPKLRQLVTVVAFFMSFVEGGAAACHGSAATPATEAGTVAAVVEMPTYTRRGLHVLDTVIIASGLVI